MKIDLFAFTYNDGNFLPFFLKYYKKIVDSMTFIDSGSTDSTLGQVKPYNVIHTGLKTWDWDAGQVILENVWKTSTADYVFFPNVDEIFYHPNLKEFLSSKIGEIDIFKMKGYQMVSNTFPKPEKNILDIRYGVPFSLYNKFMIFNPKCDIKFVNAHDIKTTCRKISFYEIKLLHYKYLGVKEQVRRAELVKKRVPKNSFCKGIGGNILKMYPGLVRTREQYQNEINDLLVKAERVI